MSTNPRWKMAVDVERCIGCHACSVACKVENNVPLGRFRTKVYYLDQGKFPKVTRAFLPTLCRQCEDAPCLKACPHSAIGRGNDGIIRVDADKCEHDGACASRSWHRLISLGRRGPYGKSPEARPRRDLRYRRKQSVRGSSRLHEKPSGR